MNTYGISKLIFEHPAPSEYMFLKDSGMIKNENVWVTANGSCIEIIKSDKHGLISVEWASDTDMEFIDINGIKHIFTSHSNLLEVTNSGRYTNTFSNKVRINKQIEIEDNTQPCAIAHLAVFTPDINQSCELFKKVGFVVSDSIFGRCIFMRSKEENPHHQILLVQSIDKHGLQHVALAVADIYTVFTKGISMSRKGWTTLLGPGRHVISSSTHWYFNTELGSFEISCDEDYLTKEWQPTEYDPSTSTVYEWAIEGGIDPYTKRQKGVQLLSKFIDERMKQQSDL